MFKSKEVTTIDRIRTFQRSDKANKQCANCGEMGPVYVCMDFHTFVCTECSGLHRELSHKVKSISMSNWTNDECDLLERLGGNTHDHQLYLATHDPRIYPIPSSTNKDKLREFIRFKYMEKRWILDPSKSKPSIPASTGPGSPRNDITKKKDKKDKKAKDTVHFANDDLLVMENPIRDISNVSQPSLVSISPEEEIHSHFSRGIELLEKLYTTNPILAQNITKTVEASLTQQFLVTRHSTPVVAAVTPVGSSTNPFDFLASPVVASLNNMVMTNHTSTTHKQVAPANPFDFFQ